MGNTKFLTLSSPPSPLLLPNKFQISSTGHKSSWILCLLSFGLSYCSLNHGNQLCCISWLTTASCNAEKTPSSFLLLLLCLNPPFLPFFLLPLLLLSIPLCSYHWCIWMVALDKRKTTHTVCPGFRSNLCTSKALPKVSHQGWYLQKKN